MDHAMGGCDATEDVHHAVDAVKLKHFGGHTERLASERLTSMFRDLGLVA